LEVDDGFILSNESPIILRLSENLCLIVTCQLNKSIIMIVMSCMKPPTQQVTVPRGHDVTRCFR
jgi:hypothetical protein